MTFSSKIITKYKPKRLAVKLNSKGEQFVMQGHPWVFSNNIVKIKDDAKSGDLAIIVGKNKNRVVGLGLYDASSPIRIILLYSGTEKVEINASFFKFRIDEALKIRSNLLKTNTNSYRLVCGENEGVAGLIAEESARG